MGDRLATMDTGRKEGAAKYTKAMDQEGELGPHLTRCGRGRGLPPCQLSILIHPTIWPQYTNVTDSQTDR